MTLHRYRRAGRNHFEKCMKVPDSILTYFRLTTDIQEESYMGLIERDIREAHFAYAREIVRIYHGESAVPNAESRYLSVASGGMPDNMDILTIEKSEISIVELLKRAGFASSNSDSRRLIAGGGVKINGETVTNTDLTLSDSSVLSRGKNKFIRVKFTAK